MPLSAALPGLLLAGIGAAAAAAEEPKLEVRVDPRVEMLSIVFRLAGNREYAMPNSASPYSSEVEERFGPFKGHPAVAAARALRATRGVSYDAVMSFATHLSDGTSLTERVPFDPRPARLDERWTPDGARDFLSKLRAFAEETRFAEFVSSHEAFYRAAAKRLADVVSDRARLGWFDGFFGEVPGASYVVVVGLLTGGGNYGVGVIHPDGREEITPVIGAYRFDSEGLPVYDDAVLPTVAHEFCHSYSNRIVDRNLETLAPAGERLFTLSADAMRRQAYGNAKTLLYETLVRACVVRWRAAGEGNGAAIAEIEEQKKRGFPWIEDAVLALARFEASRREHPTFDAFAPELAKALLAAADRLEAAAAKAPKIVSMTPENGATGVEASLAAIVVTFDRPMRDKGWSVVGSSAEAPPSAGSPFYDEKRLTITIPVKLEPKKTYRFSLNSARFDSFRS